MLLSNKNCKGKSEVHIAQLLFPIDPEFSAFRPYVWLVRERCPSQGYFVSECRQAFENFIRDHFPRWDFNNPYNTCGIGALRIAVGLGKGYDFLPGQNLQFGLLGCTAGNFEVMLTKKTSSFF